MFVYAAGHTAAAQSLLQSLLREIIWPAMGLMTTIAFFWFLWGLFQYVYYSDNEMRRQVGRSHMIYGVIGMVVMVSALSILTIAANTFGVGIP